MNLLFGKPVTKLNPNSLSLVRDFFKMDRKSHAKKIKLFCLKRLEKMAIIQLVGMANTIFHAKFQIDIFIFEALIRL